MKKIIKWYLAIIAIAMAGTLLAKNAFASEVHSWTIEERF